MTHAARVNRSELSQIQNTPRKLILVVEDDVSLQPIVRRMVRKLDPDATIEWATDVDNAITLIDGHHDQRYDLILADVILDGDRSGLDLIRECEVKKIASSCVVTSGSGEGILGGAQYPFLPKPYDFDTFRKCIAPYLAPRRGVGTAGKVFSNSEGSDISEEWNHQGQSRPEKTSGRS